MGGVQVAKVAQSILLGDRRFACTSFDGINISFIVEKEIKEDTFCMLVIVNRLDGVKEVLKDTIDMALTHCIKIGKINKHKRSVLLKLIYEFDDCRKSEIIQCRVDRGCRNGNAGS